MALPFLSSSHGALHQPFYILDATARFAAPAIGRCCNACLAGSVLPEFPVGQRTSVMWIVQLDWSVLRWADVMDTLCLHMSRLTLHDVDGLACSPPSTSRPSMSWLGRCMCQRLVLVIMCCQQFVLNLESLYGGRRDWVFAYICSRFRRIKEPSTIEHTSESLKEISTGLGTLFITLIIIQPDLQIYLKKALQHSSGKQEFEYRSA